MNDPRGSIWRKWDLHVHTPASYDYLNHAVQNQDIVDCFIEKNVHVMAITDHHVIDVDRIRDLQRLGAGRLTILPGIELRSDHGGDPIHYICLFSETCNLGHVWTTLQGSLGLTPKGIKDKGGDDKIYVPIERASQVTRELGGLISIHAGTKANSIDSIKNHEQFQRRIKYDITQQYVDLMEIGQIKDIDVHYKVIFPNTGLERPLLVCSDNHNIADYSVKAPLWLRADPCFLGLRMAICEPRERVFIGVLPEEITRVSQNKTKYIKSLTFTRLPTLPVDQKWFHGKVEFNSGLIAIVGNKGSGKSALADTLGLLGDTKNAHDFSFLKEDRFCRPTGGFAQHFQASLEWADGEPVTRRLDGKVKPQAVERIKYLPQDHVENVCNELATGSEGGFEQELKSVIFSHVPEPQRLKHQTLDDLVRFQTEEKQSRVDALIRQVREVSRRRATLETQADPAVRRELQEKIKRRELELKALDDAPPEAVPNPADQKAALPEEQKVLQELQGGDEAIANIKSAIAQANSDLVEVQRREAVARRMIDRIGNFSKEFRTFQATLQTDAAELGLNAADLVTIQIDRAPLETLMTEARQRIQQLRTITDNNDPPGLKQQLQATEARTAELQRRLDGPAQAYQAYLRAKADWEKKRAAIAGKADDPESLAGLKATLNGLGSLDQDIKSTREQQVQLRSPA